MIQLLGFLLIIILLIVLVPILVISVWGINKYYQLRDKFTGGGSSYRKTGSADNSGRSSAYGGTSGYSSGSSSRKSTSSSARQHGKIIPKDEGEYVDYEVVE